MFKIALVMHSSKSPNLGVGALTVSEVAILRDIAHRLGIEISIEILDWAGPSDEYVEGPDITVRNMTGRTLVSPFGFFEYVRNVDLVIDIGAGDSFADIYGRKRLNRMFLLKYLVHLAGKPLVLGPQTYGPFTKSVSSWMARHTFKRSVLVASRDELSTKEVGRIAPSVNVVEASDVALRLPFARSQKDPHQRIVQVGLNVSGLLMNGGYSGKNMFGLGMNYQEMIKELIERFLNHPTSVQLHLVSHVITPDYDSIENDMKVAAELANDFPEVVLAPAFRDPSEAKSYIAGLDFFAGARMHACIAAFSSGVPVVPMAYSRKFEGLFGTMGYQHTVDCTRENAHKIIEKVIEGFDSRDSLKHETLSALARGMEKLESYEKELERIILRIANEKDLK